MALNQSNFGSYQKLNNIIDKFAFLQRLLCSHIVSFAKGTGISLDQQIKVHITDVPYQYIRTFKAVPMHIFTLNFKSNFLLPSHIGLGKSVSLGFGTVVGKKVKRNELENKESEVNYLEK